MQQSMACGPPCAHKDLGIWQTWTWAQISDKVRAFAVGLRELGLERGDTVADRRREPPAPLLVHVRGAERSARVPVPVYADGVADEMAYVLDHAEVTLRRGAGPGAGRQAASPSPTGCRGCDRSSTTRTRGLRDYDHGRLHSFAHVQELGRQRSPRTPGPTGRVARRHRGAARARTSRHPLHLGHHRPAQGRDADLRQHRRSRPATATPSTSSDETRRCSPICRWPGSATTSSPTRSPIVGGLLRQLPREPGDRHRGPARDRHRPTSSRRRACSRTCSP